MAGIFDIDWKSFLFGFLLVIALMALLRWRKDMRDAADRPPIAMTGDLRADVLALMRQDRKIEAIKLVR